jgi:hypothetical protein
VIDQVIERVGGSRLVAVFFDLAEVYVVDDQELGSGPRFEPPRLGAVGEPGVARARRPSLPTSIELEIVEVRRAISAHA